MPRSRRIRRLHLIRHRLLVFAPEIVPEEVVVVADLYTDVYSDIY